MSADGADDTQLDTQLDGQQMLPAISLAILSRPGGRAYNEDACGHWHSERHLCCVVADGAGGHGGGDVAARLAVQHVIAQCASTPPADPGEVKDLLLSTNAAVIRHRSDAPSLAQMHSTVVGLFIDLETGQALWGHAGDSRLYLFREGRMLAHTRDHSLVQSMVDARLIGPEELRTHPRRSELLSALGTAPEELSITAAGRPWRLEAGDVFLLCTDGLWEYVDDEAMCESLHGCPDAQSWLSRLEVLVLRNAAQLGRATHDNFSAISVWVGSPSPA